MVGEFQVDCGEITVSCSPQSSNRLIVPKHPVITSSYLLFRLVLGHPADHQSAFDYITGCRTGVSLPSK